MRMPRLKPILAISMFPVCAFFIGCAAIRFSQYTGTDASSLFGTWPNGLGSMSETSFAVPVFRGWPERPYLLLGSVRLANPNDQWDEGDISAAAREAKRRGGNAIIIRQGAEFGVSKIAGAKGDPWVLSSPYQTTALVVRWLTEAELQKQRALLDDMLKRFYLDQPNLSVYRDVGWMVAMLLVQSGLGATSHELFGRFAEIMERLGRYTPDSIAGDWVFKTTLSASTFLSSGDERGYLGTAKVSVDGENIAIVSDSGRVEINFSGTNSKGRMIGQIGVGTFSAKCEGAATSEKISISFQSMTPDGAVRGNVVLQRLPIKPNDHEKPKPNPSGKRAQFGSSLNV